eukprot:Colp12_sorted_trinity150504_noHs@13790
MKFAAILLLCMLGVNAAFAAGELKCNACKLFIGEIDKLIASDSTEAAIKADLQQVCAKLPKFTQGICNHAVEEHVDELTQAIVAGLKPEDVCSKIQFCPVAEAKVQANEFTCAICKFALEEAGKQLTNNVTETKIEAGLEQACGLLPGAQAVRDTCTGFVKTQTKVILESLAAGADKEKICEQVTLCTPAAAIDFKLEGALQCNICKAAVTKGRELFDAKEPELAAKVETAVCTKLPPAIQEPCKSGVEAALKIVVSNVEDKLTPDAVCTEIQACP